MLKPGHAQTLLDITRRHFFGQGQLSASAHSPCVAAERTTLRRSYHAKPPHHPAKAKSIIYPLHGGRSLAARSVRLQAHVEAPRWTDLPEDLIKGERFAFIKGVPKLLGSPHKFARHGESGAELSSLLPHLARWLTRSRSSGRCTPRSSTMLPAQIFMNTGPSDSRTAEHGRLADIWARLRKQGLAGIRGDAFRQERTRWREILLRQRISAFDLSGRRVPPIRRSRSSSFRTQLG